MLKQCKETALINFIPQSSDIVRARNIPFQQEKAWHLLRA